MKRTATKTCTGRPVDELLSRWLLAMYGYAAGEDETRETLGDKESTVEGMGQCLIFIEIKEF